jgi:hypothetical protein
MNHKILLDNLTFHVPYAKVFKEIPTATHGVFF